MTAKEIVSKLLEYGFSGGADGPERPGGPEDPWRQSTGPLPPMEFAERTPVAEYPGELEQEPPPMDAPMQVPVKPGAVPRPRPPAPRTHPRFTWRPPIG
jgi:hypothetical protein